MAPTPTERPLREALLVFTAATAVVAGLWHLGAAVPFVARNLPTLVAVVFLYVPVAIAWRRGEEVAQYGFNLHHPRRTAAFALGVPAVIFPLFLVGFVGWYALACAPGPLRETFAAVAPAGLCRRFLGWAGAHPRLPVDFGQAVLTQLVVVALPEELFFRGYLLERLEKALPARHHLLGGGIGLALVLSALLFALGHVLVDLDARRLAVFFPGLLFGWMRSATGSIFAGAAVHAASNLYIEALHRTFFR